MVNSGPATQDF